MPTDDHLGTDLRLLDDLRHQAGRGRGSDLETVTAGTGQVDLALLAGADNIAQALLLRMLTPYGELAGLGHPDYGSRLYELIGELNTVTNRNRAKVYALQALAGELRVAQVISLDVTAPDRNTILLSAVLKIIDADTPLNLVFPFFLGGGPAAAGGL
jgi:phage gp46-like protein